MLYEAERIFGRKDSTYGHIRCIGIHLLAKNNIHRPKTLLQEKLGYTCKGYSGI
jgi:hypothetical protein